jgi:hypothetical protein
LYETKSNEKLTARGVENIEQFYWKLTDLWNACPVPFKLKMALLFRKLFHAGKNPDELNNNSEDFPTSGSNALAFRNRVTDKEYIMERMKVSGALVGIVNEFNFAANLLDYKFGNAETDEFPVQAGNSYDQIDDPNYIKNNSPTNPMSSPTTMMKNGKMGFMTYEEELAFYGVPIPPKKEEIVAATTQVAVDPENESQNLNDDNASLNSAVELEQQSSPQHQPQEQEKYEDEKPVVELNKAIMRELSQLMLNLCLDITNANEEAAVILCENGLCDGVMILIEKDFNYDCREKRISYDIELLWNVIEPFYEKVRVEYEKTNVISTKSAPNTPRSSNLPASPSFNNSATGGGVGNGGGSFFDDNASLATAANTNLIEKAQSISVNYHSFILQQEQATGITIVNLEKAIGVLTKILTFLINDGFRQSDKELRNEILIILSILAEFPFAIGHFIHTELLHLLLTYACVEEIGHKKWPFFLKFVANVRNFATVSDSDLEFKKSIWNLMTILSKFNDVDVLLSISASPLIPCLLNYLEYHGESAGGASSKTGHSPSRSGGGHTHGASHAGGHSTVSKTGGGIPSMPSVSSYGGGHNNASILENSDVLISKSMNLADSMTKSVAGGGGLVPNSLENTQMGKTTGGGVQKKSLISQLTPSKLKEFQVQASIFLVLNGQKYLCEIERLQGVVRVINLLLFFTTHLQESPDSKTIIYNLLIFIYKAVQNSVSIRTYLEDNQGIAILLHLFSTCYQFMIHSATSGNSSQNLILEECCSQIIRIVSLLCDPNNHFCQEQFQLNNGIKLLLQPVKSYVQKRPPIIGLKAGLKIINNADLNDPYIDPLDNPFGGEISIVIIAIINCFSKSIVGNLNNEIAFADFEGLDLLLDLLEIAPFILRIHILRLLSDLLMNGLLIPYIYSWRSGKTLRSASQLICHAWLDEEARLNTERKDSSGIICDLFNPLGNQNWPKADFELPLLGGSQTLSLSLANTASPLLNGNAAANFQSMNNSSFFLPSSTVLNAALTGGGGGPGGQSSVIVSKLATAILAGRNAIQTNLPIDISLKVLQTDSRVILGSILQNLKLFEIYNIENENNPLKPNYSIIHANTSNMLLDEDNNNPHNHHIYNPNVQQNNDAFTQQLSPQYNHIHGNNNNHNNNNNNQAVNNGPNNNSNIQEGTESNYLAGNTDNKMNGLQEAPSLTYHSTTNVNLNNILHGFDEIKLTPKEKQVLSVAKKYIMLKEAEWWKTIYYNLLFQGLIPIESDMTLIDMRLEYAYDAAMALQIEQMKLFNENEDLKKQSENAFLDQILTKKNQQIKAEWLKKNAKGGFKKRNLQSQQNNKHKNHNHSAPSTADGNDRKSMEGDAFPPSSRGMDNYNKPLSPLVETSSFQ